MGTLLEIVYTLHFADTHESTGTRSFLPCAVMRSLEHQDA